MVFGAPFGLTESVSAEMLCESSGIGFIDRASALTLLFPDLCSIWRFISCIIIAHLANFAEGFGVLSSEVQAEWTVYTVH